VLTSWSPFDVFIAVGFECGLAKGKEIGQAFISNLMVNRKLSWWVFNW